MPIQFTPAKDDGSGNEDPHIFKTGVLHSLIIEEPPKPALRRFYSWNSPGQIEIFGGLQGRPFAVECWINDSSFVNYSDIDNYLSEVDQLTGKNGLLSVSVGNAITNRSTTTFMGLSRSQFNGQRNAEPLLAFGTHSTNYGNWHMSAVLNFFQLDTQPAAVAEDP